MTVFLVFTFVLLFFLVCIHFAKTEGYYSTMTIFGIGCFLYYLGIPIELLCVGETFLPSGGGEYNLSVSQLNLLIFLGIVAFFAFALGYKLSGYSKYVLMRPPHASFNKVPYGFLFLFIGASCCLLLFYRQELILISSYAEAYKVTYQSPVFALLRIFSMVMLAVIGGCFLLNKGKRGLGIGILIGLFLIFFGLYSKSKDPIVLAFLTFAVPFSGASERKVLFLILIVFAAVVVVASFVLFTLFRAGVDLRMIGEYGHLFGIRYLDPGGPARSIFDAMNDKFDLRYGATYFDFIKIIIPKVFWPERSLDIAEAYAQMKMSGEWSAGKGMGFSPMAEALINFSFYGAFIQYFFVGLCWGGFWRLMRRLSWHIDSSIWRSLYVVLGYYILVIFHRNHTAGLMKTMVLFILPPLFITILLDQMMFRKKRKAMTGAIQTTE